MELYLESHDLKEIEEAFKSGIPMGLTTTPAFIQRSNLTDETALIQKISGIASLIQIDALGEKSETIVHEAHRLIEIGNKAANIIFRIPVSMEGIKACRILSNEGIKISIQSVFTLQQAYVAMQAGAAYVSIPVGKLNDFGYDSTALLEQVVSCARKYNYSTKIMISAIRTSEQIRTAIHLGVHAIALPWNIMKGLTENEYSQQSNQQFFENNRLQTTLVKDAINGLKPQVKLTDTILDAVIQMSQGGLGAVAVLNENDHVVGVFTDGDLRRLLQGNGKDILAMKLSDLKFKQPISIDSQAYLKDAAQILKDKRIDNILVLDEGKLIGILDIQDLN